MMAYSPGDPAQLAAFMEYGNGTIGDMGIHMFDMVRWFMGLGWPKRDLVVWRPAGAQGRQTILRIRRRRCSTSTT